MLAVVQRVAEASVAVAPSDAARDGYRARIGPGLCVLLGVETGDTDADADWIAAKIARLRIFRDEEGKMNRSVQETAGAILLVSQFTLAGDCERGNRPSFVRAADPATGERLYALVGERLRAAHGLPVETGVFGAMMHVSLVNDGPVTLILRRGPGA